MRRRRSIGEGAGRAQTLPDFVIGITVFLLVIAFIVAFVPQLTAPYQEQETSVVVERITSDLAGDLLAEPGASRQLNESCTVAFFTDGTESDCPFDAENTVNERLGVSSGYSVNVTLRENVSGGGDSEILCADGDSIATCGPERLAIGPSVPPDGRSMAASHRAVSIGGRYAVLEVRVW